MTQSVGKKVKQVTGVEGDPKALHQLLHRKVGEGATLSTGLLHLSLICTLYCWVLSKEVSSTVFKVTIGEHSTD